MNMKSAKLLMALLLLGVAPSAWASVIVIDDFSAAAPVTAMIPPGNAASDSTPGGLGGQRDITVTGPSGANVGLTLGFAAGQLRFFSGSTSGNGDVLWDGTPSSDNPFINEAAIDPAVNFSGATGQVFWLVGDPNKAPLYSALTITLTLYKTPTSFQSATFGAFQNVPELGFAALIPFSAFGIFGVDNIKGVTLSMRGNTQGEDATFDAIGAGLPEPTGALGFAVVGLPLVGAWRRWRRKA